MALPFSYGLRERLVEQILSDQNNDLNNDNGDNSIQDLQDVHGHETPLSSDATNIQSAPIIASKKEEKESKEDVTIAAEVAAAREELAQIVPASKNVKFNGELLENFSRNGRHFLSYSHLSDHLQVPHFSPEDLPKGVYIVTRLSTPRILERIIKEHDSLISSHIRSGNLFYLAVCSQVTAEAKPHDFSTIPEYRGAAKGSVVLLTEERGKNETQENIEKFKKMFF